MTKERKSCDLNTTTSKRISMKHIDGHFKNVDNADIYYQAWLPDESLKAIILLAHGLGEYCGRYANHVSHFVPLGYAIYGLDHLGHGKSGGEREVINVLPITLNLLCVIIRWSRGGTRGNLFSSLATVWAG